MWCVVCSGCWVLDVGGWCLRVGGWGWWVGVLQYGVWGLGFGVQVLGVMLQSEESRVDGFVVTLGRGPSASCRQERTPHTLSLPVVHTLDNQ